MSAAPAKHEALVVLVAGSPEPTDLARVAQLCSQARYVIAADKGYSWCRRAQVVPQLYVGDSDSVEPADLAALESSGVARVDLSWHKDMTDLEVAFEQGEAWAVQKGASPHFVVLCALGGRLDHELAVLGTCRRYSRWAIDLIGATQKVQLVAPGAREEVRVGEPREVLSVVPLADNTSISEEGFEWLLDHHVMDALSDRGISNIVRASAGAVVRCHGGCAAVIQSLRER